MMMLTLMFFVMNIEDYDSIVLVISLVIATINIII